MEVRELTPIGLGGELTDAQGVTGPNGWDPGRLRELLHRHGVLVLRGTALDDRGVLALSRLIGDPDEVTPAADRVPGQTYVRLQSNVPGLGVRADVAGGFWHTDDGPALATLLRAVEVPAKGGGTVFADMRAAWRALPAADQAKLAGLHGWWPARQLYAAAMSELGGGSAEVLDTLTDEVRPLVRRTVTGEEALHLSKLWLVQVRELDQEASKELLASLYAHATSDTYTYTHTWQAGDVLIWDNEAVMHRAMPVAEGCRKVTHRITVRYPVNSS